MDFWSDGLKAVARGEGMDCAGGGCVLATSWRATIFVRLFLKNMGGPIHVNLFTTPTMRAVSECSSPIDNDNLSLCNCMTPRNSKTKYKIYEVFSYTSAGNSGAVVFCLAGIYELPLSRISIHGSLLRLVG